MTTTKVRFNRLRDGRYIQPDSGIELIRGTDDSDGYNVIEWQIWTAGMGKCLGTVATLGQAKSCVRERIVAWAWDDAVMEYSSRCTSPTLEGGYNLMTKLDSDKESS